MDDDQREILHAVAAGTLTPTEGAERLRRLRGGSVGGDPTDDGSGVGTASRDTGVDTLRIRCSLTEVRLVGDPTVAGAIAEGPHEARTEGRTLVITDRTEGRGFTFGARRGFVGLGRRTSELRVRAHPDLALEVEVSAGDLRVTGMHGPVTASVGAGSIDLDGFDRPIELKVGAGTIEARGRLTAGSSVVQCRLGEIMVELDADSDVTATARAKVGEVRLPDDGGGAGIDLSHHRYVMGAGTAELDISTSAGAVELRRRA